MIELAAVALAALALAALMVWDRRRPSGEVTALLETVDQLCRRIQAPQVAAVEYLPHAPDPPAVNPEVDEEYWMAQGMTKEDLARLADEVERG